MEQPARIVVRRPRSFQDWTRGYRLELDGRPVCEIAQNQEIVMPVAPGWHQFRAVLAWSASDWVPVLAVPGRTTLVTVEPSGPAITGLARIKTTSSWLRVTVAPPA